MFHPNQITKAAATDFLTDLDITDDELLYLLDLAAEVKESPAAYSHSLEGKNLGMLFEKPSLPPSSPSNSP
jgi:ornithine carbamoyltransferase